ncbi:MAG TPA: biotin--[acetyl-CoA-carboxylase] ligase, partial [Pseudolabrys sp.]
MGSTNAEALERARWRELGPLWITALSQTAGRGRRGSAWTSPKGNLYASLLLSDPSPKPLAPQLSFVAALALHDALGDCAPRLGPLFKVKWPNDLLLGPDKLAGILVEGQSDGAFNVVIGFGVNCVSHPLDTFYPATDLLQAGAVVAPEALFAALSAAMLRRLSQWQSGSGFASIRADWL